MKILVYQWEAYNYRDIIDTFLGLGHNVEVFSYKLDNYDENEAFRALLGEKIDEQGWDFVFTVNYFAVIAEVCHERGLRYVSWTCDSPLISMFHDSVFLDTNRIFTFDLVGLDTFRSLGVDNIEYLPLAVNTDRLDSLLANAQDLCLFRNDISFVGSLYERNYYDTVAPHMSEYLRGYLSAVMELQSDYYREVIIDRALVPEVLEQIGEYFTLEPSSEGSFSDLGLIFSTTVLGYKAAQLQRKAALIELSKHFDVGLYTGSDVSDLLRVGCRGSVEYWTEMPKVFYGSRINLNFTIPNIRSGLPLRIWDILGAGGFLLTNPQPELKLYFDEDEIAVFSSRAELVEKCGYFLKHDEQRQAMAARARAKVKKYHNYRERISQMMQVL